MRKKAAQLLLSALSLLLSLPASGHLTPSPLPGFPDSDLAPLSVAVAVPATLGNAIDNAAYDDVHGGVRVVVVVFPHDPERGYVGIVGRDENGAIWILYEGKLPLGLREWRNRDGHPRYGGRLLGCSGSAISGIYSPCE